MTYDRAAYERTVRQRRALDRLVESHLCLCRSETLRWAHLPVELEDLDGEARVGLVRAARRYDATRGIPFAAYARWHIRGAIISVIGRNARREHTPDGFISEVSVNQPDGLVLDLPDPRASVPEEVIRREDMRLIASLPARERIALIRTEVDGLSAAVVGEELGVSVARVYQLVHNGSERLRRRAA